MVTRVYKKFGRHLAELVFGLAVFALLGCGNAMLPTGELPAAAPTGVVYSPDDEAPIVSGTMGLVRAPIVGGAPDPTPTAPMITYTGASN